MSRLFDNVCESSAAILNYDVPVFEGYTEEAAGHIMACAEAHEDMTSVYEAMHQVAMIELAMEKDTVNESSLEIAMENAVTNAFGKIKSMIMKLWGKLKNFFASIIMNIDAKLKSAKDFAKKYMPKLEDAEMASKKKFEMELYPYTNADTDVAAMAYTKISRTYFQVAANNIGNKEKFEQQVRYLTGNKEEVIEAMRGSVTGQGRLTSEEFTEKITEYFRGARDKSKRTLSASEISKVLENAKTKDVIKSAKKDMDKSFADWMKSIQDRENEAKSKEKPTDQDKRAVKSAQITGAFANTGASIATSIFNIWKSVQNERIGAYKTYTIKAIQHANKQ